MKDYRIKEENYYWLHPQKGGGGNPYNGLYGEAPPKRGTFFRLQVYERVGKSVISVCKKAQKGLQMHFMAVKRSKKKFWVCYLFIFLKRYICTS